MVKVLTLKLPWLEPGFVPDTLYEAPFVEFDATPRFNEVVEAEVSREPIDASLEAFALELLGAVEIQLDALTGPIHCLLSGGYDSRILATLLERLGKRPIYITDGDEEPQCSNTLDYLEIPKRRRYLHSLDRPDPYGLADATVRGYAPLYHQMRFMPGDEKATLVTGLGGGEWFSYPAAGWHTPRKHRTDHADLRAMWVDTWPQYWLLPDAWSTGYAAMLNPYCSPLYAKVANRCRSEWLVEVDRRNALDMVRKAMLDALDENLADLGWVPHQYDWRLDVAARDAIDDRFWRSWLAQKAPLKFDGLPSQMHGAEHACLMAGFAQWCDELIASGYEIRLSE